MTRAKPSSRATRIAPMPSTWPWTMCPPRRSSALTGSSRLTCAPAATSASEERRSVSFMTSAPKRSPLRPTAVRQTPLTLTESPSESSRASGDSIASRTPSLVECTSATVPRSATRPVNNRLPLPQPRRQQDVAGHALALEGQRAQRVGDRVDALALQRVARRAPAEQQRGDEEPQLVDLARVEERAGQVRAVGQRRADADGNRVAGGAPLVGDEPAVLGGDPLRVAGLGGDLAVEAHRRLEQHPRAARARMLAKGLVLLARAGGQLAACKVDLHALVA